jgi:flagellar basal-body rod modification protein FlgD
MTFPLAGLGSTPATQPKPAGSRNDMGKDQFLTLLVAQLKHQDPLSPLQADQFAAQLAQFSTVEQLTKLNATVASQQQDSALQGMMSQTALGASLIGKHVLAQGDQITVGSNAAASIEATIGGSGGKATLTIVDGAGQTVATQPLGSLGGGNQTINLPNNLPAGTYTCRLEVKDAQGNTVPTQLYTQGVVDGVQFDGGTIWLRIGGTRVSIDKLSLITP